MTATPISEFQKRAETLVDSIGELLKDVRLYLDEQEQESFFEAEADLCDAHECVQDFIEHCQNHQE